MKCNNDILLIEDSQIILFHNNEIFKTSISKLALEKGIVINAYKFYEDFYKFYKTIVQKRILLKKNMTIIHQDYLSTNDIKQIYNIFNERNYCFSLLNNSSFLNLKKNKSFLIWSSKVRLYYIDKNNTKRKLELNLKELDITEIIELIEKRIKKASLFIINGNELINYFDKSKIEYYLVDIKDIYFKNYN